VRKQAIKRCYILPPHLINAPVLTSETENTEIVSFHINISCWFAKLLRNHRICHGVRPRGCHVKNGSFLSSM